MRAEMHLRGQGAHVRFQKWLRNRFLGLGKAVGEARGKRLQTSHQITTPAGTDYGVCTRMQYEGGCVARSNHVPHPQQKDAADGRKDGGLRPSGQSETLHGALNAAPRQVTPLGPAATRRLRASGARGAHGSEIQTAFGWAAARQLW